MSRRGLLGLGVGALAACSGLSPSPEAEAQAKLAYQRLVLKQDAELEAMFLASARGPRDLETFAMMRSLIPTTAVLSAERLNWRTYAGTGGQTVTYQHAYDYGDRTVIATTVLVPGGDDGWMLRSFNVNTTFSKTPAPKAAADAKAT